MIQDFDIFGEILFGSGALIGLMLVIILLFAITIINKYGGIFAMCISVLMFLEYAARALGWHAILVLLCGIFGVLSSSYQLYKTKRG